MPLKSRRTSWVCALFAVLASQSVYAQGFGRGGGNPDDFFNRIDTNGNQQLDPEELQNSPLRRMLEAGGRDLSKPITKAEFTEMTQQFMQRFRGGGMRGPMGGPPGTEGPPGGPPAAPGGPPSPTVPPSPPGGAPAGGGAPPAAPTTGSPAAPGAPPAAGSGRPGSEAQAKPATGRTRAPQLPEEYASKDTNGDGQLGLYEWPRTDFATFQKLDLNNDGFVTAAELTKKDKPRGAAPVNRGSGPMALAGGGPPAGGGSNRGGGPSRTGRADESRESSGRSGDSGGRGGESGGRGDRSRGGGSGRGSMPPAERAFTALDLDKNGSLSEEEWQRSVSVKAQFEREGISLSFPVSKADFEAKYPQRR